MTKPRADVDIAVIGAGIIGSSCAYHLTRAGWHVALIDAAYPTAGTSGACDGFLSVATKSPGIMMALAVASRAAYPGLAATLGDVEFQRRPGLLIVEDEADLPKIAAHVETVHATGAAIAMVDRAALLDLEPSLSPALRGGALSRDDFLVNPHLMTLALAQGAVAGGARAFWYAKPLGFDVAGGAVRAVELPEHVVRAEQVVLCAGVWSEALGATLGLRLPVRPRRGELVVTERLADPPRHVLVSAKYLTAKADPEAAEASSDPLVRLGHGFLLETTTGGQCIIGSTRTFSGFDRTASRAGVAAIVGEAVKRVPRLAHARMWRSFAGLRPFVPDKKPIIGRSARLTNVLVATGHEGDGITLAPITGMLIADLARGRAPALDIAALSPDRFAA
jgi:sarcosine oxidase subunit beta